MHLDRFRYPRNIQEILLEAPCIVCIESATVICSQVPKPKSLNSVELTELRPHPHCECSSRQPKSLLESHVKILSSRGLGILQSVDFPYSWDFAKPRLLRLLRLLRLQLGQLGHGIPRFE